MPYPALNNWRNEQGLDLLSALEKIDLDPFARDIPHEVRVEAREFMHGASRMFAPVGLTDEECTRRADRRVDHFDV